MQCITRDLGRIQNTQLHQIAILTGRGVVAKVALAFNHLVHDNRRLVTGVLRDHAQWFFDGAQDDLDTGVLFGIVALDLAGVGTCAQECDAATRNDTFFNSSAGGVQSIFHACFLFLHFDFGRRTDTDHGNTACQLGNALLQLFFVVVAGRVVDLFAHRRNTRLDGFLVTGAVDDRGVFLAHFDLLRTTQILQGHVLEFQAEFFRDHSTAGQDRDVFQHGFATIAETWRLDGGGFQDAAQVVHDQGGQCLTIDIFGDDQQRTTGLGDLFEYRQQVTNVGNLLVVQHDEWIFQQRDLLVRVVDEIGRQVAAIELHAFDDFQFHFQALAVFDSDDAFLANLFHGFSDLLANIGIRVGGDRTYLGDFFVGGGRLGDFLQFRDDGDDRFVDTALQIHRVHAGGNIFHAFDHDGLCQHRGGSGAVTGHIGGLGSDFLDHLCAHVFEFVLQFDFLGDGYTVLGDGRRAKRALEHHVTALRAQGDFDCVGENVHAMNHADARVAAEFDFFRCHDCYLVSEM